MATGSENNSGPADEEKLKERMQRISETWRARGFDPDMSSLMYFGDRNEVAPYLSDRGWDVATRSAHDLFAANGFPPFDGDNVRMGDHVYVSGTLDERAK